MKSQWACKKCKGKFPTMAEAKYHTCEPVKFDDVPPSGVNGPPDDYSDQLKEAAFKLFRG